MLATQSRTKDTKPHNFLSFVVVVLAFFSIHCSGTAASDCESAAKKQCDIWSACTCGETSCQMSQHQFNSADECYKSLEKTCLSQASTLNNLDEDVSACLDSLEKYSCKDVRIAHAQKSPTTTQACVYFF